MDEVKRMPVVYVAAPVRAVSPALRYKNLVEAYDWAARVWKLGFVKGTATQRVAVFSPALNTAHMDGYLGLPDKTWLDGDLEVLYRSDAIAMQPGWRDSRGCLHEHEQAEAWGKQIFYLDEQVETMGELGTWITAEYERMNSEPGAKADNWPDNVSEERCCVPTFTPGDQQGGPCNKCAGTFATREEELAYWRGRMDAMSEGGPEVSTDAESMEESAERARKIIEEWPAWKQELADRVLRPSKPPPSTNDTVSTNAESPQDAESILAQADRIVSGDRNDQYGNCVEDMQRVAEMWTPILACNVTPEQVAQCQICVKISREFHKPKDDNRRDAAGWVRVWDECVRASELEP